MVTEYPLSDKDERKIFKDILDKMELPCVSGVPLSTGETPTEIDILAVYQNLILLIECVGRDDFGEKFKKTKTNFEIIEKQLKQLSNTLKKDFKEFYDKTSVLWKLIDRGETAKVLIRKIICTTEKEDFLKIRKEYVEKSNGKTILKGEMYFLDFNLVKYFERLANLTFMHGRYEMLVFLDVLPFDINEKLSIRDPNIKATSIDSNEEKDIIVFRLLANDLLRITHVQRLYSWNLEGFQRLLMPEKINKLVRFLKERKESFPNNIIVATTVDKLKDYKWNEDKNVTFSLPNSFDIFTLIDGQHRLYAFAQGDKEIKELSEQKELIVTTIVYKKRFPEVMRDMAELFFVINTTYTKIKGEEETDLREMLYENDPVSKANRLLRKLNQENDLLQNKIKIKPFDNEYFGKSLLPKTTLIRYSGLKEIFKSGSTNGSKKGSKTFKIFSEIYQKVEAKGDFKNYEDFVFWIVDSFLKTVKTSIEKTRRKIAKEMLQDTEQMKYYFMSVTVIGAIMRLLRHFLSEKDSAFKKLRKTIKRNGIRIEDKEKVVREECEKALSVLFKNPEFKFTKREWKNKAYKSSQWALLENKMVEVIRKDLKGFGDDKLLKLKK